MVNIVGDHATYHHGFDAPLESDIETVAANCSRRRSFSLTYSVTSRAYWGTLSAKSLASVMSGGTIAVTYQFPFWLTSDAWLIEKIKLRERRRRKAWIASLRSQRQL